MALSNDLSGGILSLAVYLASVFPLVCTFLGVKVMDISTMFDWCGTVLRVLLKIQILPLEHKQSLTNSAERFKSSNPHHILNTSIRMSIGPHKSEYSIIR